MTGAEKAISIMKHAILHGENCNVVLRNYKKDGTLFWNEITITPVLDNQNQLTHFIAVQNDVTNKVKAEDLKDKKQLILELIAQNKPLKTIVKKIINTAETHIKDCFGSISLLNKNTKTLHFWPHQTYQKHSTIMLIIWLLVLMQAHVVRRHIKKKKL